MNPFTIIKFREIIKNRFRLDEDKAEETEIIESLKKGVEFKGTSLWVLIFAVVIASVGLNVNSTAVIIGAMLISPLMGPIMGIGLGIGIYDFGLIKKALKNLIVAVVFSVISSAFYFFLSPLEDAQSELLARTTPTIWDVLIALFGGFAGIIAGTRKEKSNVIPGVAIATALMPPLCTAGYGLSQINLAFFIGAMYLFFINCVFICLATFLTVRYLHLPYHQFLDAEKETRVKRYIWAVVVITLLPSLYMAYRIVNQSIFQNDANNFIRNEFNFDNTQVVNKNFIYDGDSSRIEVVLVGEFLPDQVIKRIRNKLPEYDLKRTQLIIKEGWNKNRETEAGQVRAGIIEDLYKKNEKIMKDKDERIAYLEKEISKFTGRKTITGDIYNEIKVQFESLAEYSMAESELYHAESNKKDTVVMIFLKFTIQPTDKELERLEKWLKVRLKEERVRVVIQ